MLRIICLAKLKHFHFFTCVQARKALEPQVEEKKEELEPIVHEDTFGICIVDESAPTEDSTAVAPGLRHEYESAQHVVKAEDFVPTVTESLDDLLNALKGM
eukprot:m.81977 g.81977  ORF g.81977 m.81977 type:complete len:101 (+) comp14896_c0_seq3:214-516(+)